MRSAILLLLTALAPAAAQVNDAASAAARLRTLWYQQAYLDGMNEGFTLARRFARSPEVRAWFIINYSNSGFTDQALDSAIALSKQFPRSPWADAARGFATSMDYERGAQAVPIARRAVRALPANVDIALLNAIVLQRYGKYPEAVAFIDSSLARFRANPELLSLKGEALALASRRKDADTSSLTRAKAAFAEAQRIDPNNVNAWYRAASALESSRGDTVAYRLIKRAAELSPHSSAIHSRYWSTAFARADLSDSAKRAEIEADLARFLEGRGDDPAFIYVAAGGYGTIRLTEKQREIEERLLAEFPKGRHAELVLYNRIMARDRSTLTDTAAARIESRRRMSEFVARPYHYSRSSLGSVYLNLFSSLRSDPTTTDAELLAAIRGMVKYNTFNPQWTHYDTPLLLAEKKMDLPLAKQLANESVEKWKTQIESMAAYNTTGEMAERRDQILAQKYDMLGWIAFNEGNMVEAERRLRQALDLTNRHSMIYFHLGRVAEVQGKSTEAEQHFGRGYQLETSGFGRRVENTTALKRLYTARHASLDGFDAYVEKLKEEDRTRRRARIADSRIKDPKVMPDFSLERLALDSTPAGERVTSQSLRGKLAVINFWGVWCGPCVAEMPELQKFHERMKGDTSVVFLTIDYNDTKQTVKDWMLKQKFNMPVLLDNGFVRDKARINAYPTTWFVDRDGNIMFTHVGASEVVLEEFSWRVEMLKQSSKPVP